jgi:hypothetical protein
MNHQSCLMQHIFPSAIREWFHERMTGTDFIKELECRSASLDLAHSPLEIPEYGWQNIFAGILLEPDTTKIAFG